MTGNSDLSIPPPPFFIHTRYDIKIIQPDLSRNVPIITGSSFSFSYSVYEEIKELDGLQESNIFLTNNSSPQLYSVMFKINQKEIHFDELGKMSSSSIVVHNILEKNQLNIITIELYDKLNSNFLHSKSFEVYSFGYDINETNNYLNYILSKCKKTEKLFFSFLFLGFSLNELDEKSLYDIKSEFTYVIDSSISNTPHHNNRSSNMCSELKYMALSKTYCYSSLDRLLDITYIDYSIISLSGLKTYVFQGYKLEFILSLVLKINRSLLYLVRNKMDEILFPDALLVSLGFEKLKTVYTDGIDEGSFDEYLIWVLNTSLERDKHLISIEGQYTFID
jgi:hypothetical protein